MFPLLSFTFSFSLHTSLLHGIFPLCPQVLVLHNNGVVAMGDSVGEAFSTAHSLVKACDIQVSEEQLDS